MINSKKNISHEVKKISYYPLAPNKNMVIAEVRLDFYNLMALLDEKQVAKLLKKENVSVLGTSYSSVMLGIKFTIKYNEEASYEPSEERMKKYAYRKLLSKVNYLKSQLYHKAAMNAFKVHEQIGKKVKYSMNASQRHLKALQDE